MPRRISDSLCVTRQVMEKLNILDGFIDIDAQFHIDPYLLHSATTPEFLNSHIKLENYFKEIIILLEASQNKSDRFFREATRRLVFKEIINLKLGYSSGGSPGKGIGLNLAKTIANSAYEIVKAGIKDPIIFELVGLFEEGIGADRISDMTARIILGDILKFSERIGKALGVRTRIYPHELKAFHLPYDESNKKFVVLMPLEILRNLPVALDWDDIDLVADYNRDLRNRVNQIIGNTWKQAQHIPKSILKEVLLSNPDLINDLIRQYRGKGNKQYDFKKDPAGELIWADIAEQYAKQFPLDLINKIKQGDTLSIVKNICYQYKYLIEYNGLNKLFYDDNNKLRHERFAQLLFYGIADSYCMANNLDINREPNAGNGPVDFKFSQGYFTRINVEVKYSVNPNLVKGFSTQLSIYNKAERTSCSIYLVIRTTESESNIKSLLETQAAAKQKGLIVPDIIIIDGRIKKSASKR